MLKSRGSTNSGFVSLPNPRGKNRRHGPTPAKAHLHEGLSRMEPGPLLINYTAKASSGKDKTSGGSAVSLVRELNIGPSGCRVSRFAKSAPGKRQRVPHPKLLV